MDCCCHHPYYCHFGWRGSVGIHTLAEKAFASTKPPPHNVCSSVCDVDSYLRDVAMREIRTTPADNNDIAITDITLQNLLGSGNFGCVYKGMWLSTTPVACKQIKGDYA